VIRPIETQETSEASPQRHAQKAAGPATAAGKSFAAVLARQKGVAGDQAGQLGATREAAKGGPIEAPDGEVWRPVRGDDNYAKIIKGPREGMYVNLSRGARRGQVFHVEQRDGKRVHVYGEGDDKKVVVASKDSGKVHGDRGEERDARLMRAGRGETWAPVDGANNYADILSGPRNGYFVNTSGGERDGMVFHRVRRGGRILHIYGTGEHRQVVEVGRYERNRKPDGSERTAERNHRGIGTDAPSGNAAAGGSAAAGGTGGASPDREPARPRPASSD
jgi:hypothetical protein